MDRSFISRLVKKKINQLLCCCSPGCKRVVCREKGCALTGGAQWMRNERSGRGSCLHRFRPVSSCWSLALSDSPALVYHCARLSAERDCWAGRSKPSNTHFSQYHYCELLLLCSICCFITLEKSIVLKLLQSVSHKDKKDDPSWFKWDNMPPRRLRLK